MEPTKKQNSTPDFSAVIPLLNEEESLTELTEWIDKVATKKELSYEIIFIDDGSTDDSWKVIQELSKKFSSIRAIKFRRNYGKSAALNVAFVSAAGKVVITMDADLQDSPEEIPELHRLITSEEYDLISGWKKKRYDPITKTIPTKLYNWATRKMSGIHLHDFNCGLKAYKNEVVKNIEVQGEMHRYIPVIAKWAGFSKIGEKVVEHQARKYGESKFGLERFINGFLDLFTITFVSRFGKKPMHFFGLLGTIMFGIGFLISFYLGIDKLFIHKSAKLIADQAIFYVALVAMILGTQLFLVGFLAELIIRNSDNKNDYQIETEI